MGYATTNQDKTKHSRCQDGLVSGASPCLGLTKYGSGLSCCGLFPGVSNPYDNKEDDWHFDLFDL